MLGLFKRIASISTKELEKLIKSNVTLLDVRTTDEYRSGHIATAKNVPLPNINNYQGDTNQPVYVICQSGVRSKQAASILKKKGYDVTNVKGGMYHWTGKIRGGR